jgi:GT2 family glycosyltransferase
LGATPGSPAPPRWEAKLSVVIVSYKVRYFLEQALLSVRRAAQGLRVEVFVVDNYSGDGSVEMVREKFPEVRVIANRDNPGFAKANNQAIRQAQGEYVLLLNPDTVVQEDTFRKCLDFMGAHPDAGSLGVRMIDGSGKFLPESKRGFPSPWVAFCKAFGLSALWPGSPIFNRYYLGFLDEHSTHEVEVLAGAFMLLRHDVLLETGLLDEDFFMYGEDIDLSYRIVLAGYKNYYLPSTTIIHYKGESTRKSSINYVKAFYQAMIIFARKHFSGGQAAAFVLLLHAAIYLRAMVTVVSNIFRKAWLPLTDAALMAGGLLVIKNFWAVYHFRSPGYFDKPEFYYLNMPLYVAVWLAGIYLSGGYDDTEGGIRRLTRGILASTIVVAAIYGFLPADLRFSRAILLMGAAWALLATLGLRVLVHFLRHRNLLVGLEKVKNMVIVGSEAEGERALQLIREAGVQKNFIGFVGPDAQTLPDRYLGSVEVLGDLVHIYRINEVIFCSNDVSARSIMHWMTALGGSVEIKILPERSLGIIGSHSPNTPGELYTIDVRFQIDTPMNRRNKRLFDLWTCLLLLPALPFSFFFRKNVVRLTGNWFRVLTGRLTWVGYYGGKSLSEDLPALKKSVLHPLDGLHSVQVDERTAQRLNFLYAKDYTTGRDAGIFWTGWRGLDRPV